MITAVVLFFVGMLLSAFFSGTETGFYRATRVRLQLDAMSGDQIARRLIRLANAPSLFVATTLIGNNLANFLTSFAIVLATSSLSPQYRELFAATAPLFLSPVVFVYGELLPKNLFFHAPNRLLRAAGPAIVFFTILLFPAACVLWLLARILRFFVGEAPEQMRLSLARQELQRVFDEGHEVGLLRPAQQRLAQGMLSMGDESLVRFAVPILRMVSIPVGTSKPSALRIARRNRSSILLITEEKGPRVLGYTRLLDLHLEAGDLVNQWRPILNIADTESPLSALMTLQTRNEPIARVENAEGTPLGLVSAERLVDAIMRPV